MLQLYVYRLFQGLRQSVCNLKTAASKQLRKLLQLSMLCATMDSFSSNDVVQLFVHDRRPGDIHAATRVASCVQSAA
jgi:hypothetical protein